MALHLLSFACYPDCIMMSPVKISLSRKTSHANGRVIGFFFEKVWFLANHENLSETKYSTNITSVTRSFL